MKSLCTAIFVFAFASIGFSQRTATASEASDFKTIINGFVESEFTFNQPLTEAEKTDITKWAKANEPNIYISVSADNNRLTLKLSPEYNERTLYKKTFFQINVMEIITPANGSQNAMDMDAFFELFNL